MALVGSVLEEFTFRGIILGKLLRNLQSTKFNAVIASVMLSSLLFCLSHLINLTHQDLAMTATQVLTTFALGLILSVMYLRSRSLVWGIFLHFVLDFQSFLQNGLAHATSLHPSISSGVIPLIVAIIFTSIMLRPKKQKEINFQIS